MSNLGQAFVSSGPAISIQNMKSLSICWLNTCWMNKLQSTYYVSDPLLYGFDQYFNFVLSCSLMKFHRWRALALSGSVTCLRQHSKRWNWPPSPLVPNHSLAWLPCALALIFQHSKHPHWHTQNASSASGTPGMRLDSGTAPSRDLRETPSKPGCCIGAFSVSQSCPREAL